MKNPDSLAGGPGRVQNQLHRHSTRALTADPQNAHHGPLESRCEAASTFLTERDIRAEHSKGRSLSQDDLDRFQSLGVDALSLGSPWHILVDRVVFDGSGTFHFSRDAGDDRAEHVFTIAVIGLGVGIVDICAWHREADRFALWLGAGYALGQTQVELPHLEPLPIWRSPLAWLRAGRRGIVILRPEIAWSRLIDVPVLAETIDHGRELKRLLAPPFKSKIFVPTNNAELVA